MPLPDGSMDFGYSFGVLHHCRSVRWTRGLRPKAHAQRADACLHLLRLRQLGGLVPVLWRASDYLRRVVMKGPAHLKRAVAELLAAVVYWLLARSAKLFGNLGVDVANWRLSAYPGRSCYTMRTDELDRFGTRLEHRMTRPEIRTMMKAAGLRDIRFSDAVPFWCAVGHKG